MIIIGNKELDLAAFESIALNETKIALHPEALAAVKRNFNFLNEFSSGKIIYGINTGLGPMAQYRIENDKIRELQFNLIRSHCGGAGEMIPHTFVRAILLARLNTLLLAKSGIHESVILLLADLLNNNICPVIYKHGGVGASGDLVQLAHLALCLIGEGEVSFDSGIHSASDIFNRFNLKPIEIHLREGLAVMNGTSAMTGIGFVNLIMAKKALDWSVLASSMINEIVESYDDYFSAALNDVKHHKGQSLIAAQIRKKLQGSRLIRKRPEHLYKNIADKVIKDKVQEFYSVRCVPQILGPVADTIFNAEAVIRNEVNSVNDNPVIDDVKGNVYHGGNFHGDYVSLEMDKLRICMTKLSMLAERQLNFLLNDKLNEKLPPFLNADVIGLNFGLQGVQYTATSNVAENQALSTSLYIHSIPSNKDNQDIVSMGANSALLTHQVLENTIEILAIEFLAIVQAVAWLNTRERMSEKTGQMYDLLYAISGPFIDDTVKYPVIKKLVAFLRHHTDALPPITQNN